jgi:hypothetical protein
MYMCVCVCVCVSVAFHLKRHNKKTFMPNIVDMESECTNGNATEIDNPETQSSLTIRYRTNRQYRDTITSGHKIQNKQKRVIVSLDCLFVLYLMARGDCVSGCSVSYGQR